MPQQAESALSYRERLAYHLYNCAVAAGLESGQLAYETQIDYYLKFADLFLDGLIPQREPNAHSFRLPVRAPRHTHSDRG